MSKHSDLIDPHTLPTTKLLCLWVLDHLETDTKNRFGLTEITTCLVDDVGISVTANAVWKALKRAGTTVNKSASGYRLMENGRKELASAHSNETIFIEGGKPFNAKHVELSKVFKGMKGTIKICDPYLDADTLRVIYGLVDKKSPIHIITQTIADKPVGTIKGILGDLAKEGFAIEIKQYTASGIHDRYIIDDSSMWFSGNSLNHLGNKESFIVKMGDDVAQSTRAMFDNRWKASSPF